MNRSAKGRDRPTLETIAETLGVHVSTVSRALDPERSHQVGEDTAAQVQQVAEDLGYSPHPWARSLRTNRTMTIGLVIPRLEDSVLSIMFGTAEAAASAAGYLAITASTGDDQKQEREVIRSLLGRRVDGLVIASSHLGDSVVAELAERSFPFVLMNRAEGNYPCVRGDDEGGAYAATSHLIETGHRRVGLLAGPPSTSTSRLRRRGFRRAMEDAGLEIQEGSIVDTRFDAESGYEGMMSLLEGASPPTAVFAVNDYLAIGAMSAVRAARMSVPVDVALVGFNDVPISRMMHPALTSVSLPLHSIGRMAVEMLLRLIDGEQVEGTVLPAELKVRGSSGGA